jgi:hypothetical protein
MPARTTDVDFPAFREPTPSRSRLGKHVQTPIRDNEPRASANGFSPFSASC